MSARPRSPIWLHWLVNTAFSLFVMLLFGVDDGGWQVSLVLAPICGAILVWFSRRWEAKGWGGRDDGKPTPPASTDDTP